MGVIAEGIPRGCQGLFTPVSLGYPLSVFNKNSTLKGIVDSKQELKDDDVSMHSAHRFDSVMSS